MIASCCGAVIITEEHSAGSATCTDKAACQHCGSAYGELGDHEYIDDCDSDCDVCGAERLPGHIDADKDRICDLCKEQLSSDNSGSENGDETESGNESESGDESESGGKTETETGSKAPEDDSKNTSSGDKKGCGSSIGAGALTMIISVALAGITLVKRKKGN